MSSYSEVAPLSDPVSQNVEQLPVTWNLNITHVSCRLHIWAQVNTCGTAPFQRSHLDLIVFDTFQNRFSSQVYIPIANNMARTMCNEIGFFITWLYERSVICMSTRYSQMKICKMYTAFLVLMFTSLYERSDMFTSNTSGYFQKQNPRFQKWIAYSVPGVVLRVFRKKEKIKQKKCYIWFLSYSCSM